MSAVSKIGFDRPNLNRNVNFDQENTTENNEKSSSGPRVVNESIVRDIDNAERSEKRATSSEFLPKTW